MTQQYRQMIVTAPHRILYRVIFKRMVRIRRFLGDSTSAVDIRSHHSPLAEDLSIGMVRGALRRPQGRLNTFVIGSNRRLVGNEQGRQPDGGVTLGVPSLIHLNCCPTLHSKKAT
jgi:hypothetical protein